MIYYHIDNIQETRTLKSGSGQLVRLTVNRKGSSGSSLILYDGVNDTSPIIADIDTYKCDSYMEYDFGFQDGLTYKTSANPGDITVNYS